MAGNLDCGLLEITGNSINGQRRCYDMLFVVCGNFVSYRLLGDRLSNASPSAIEPLSVCAVCV